MSVAGWWKRNRHAWNEGRAPTVHVGAARAGSFAKISGRVVLDGDPVVSLYSGTRCAIWEAIVNLRDTSSHEAIATRGMSVERWTEGCDVATTTPFHLVDDEGARIEVARDFAIYRLKRCALSGDHPTFNNENPNLARFLRDNGVQPRPFMGATGDYNFVEACVLEGDRLTIYGKIEEITSVESSGYRDQAVTSKRIAGTDDERIIVRA